MVKAESNDLAAEVAQLPVQPGAAMRLLWMLEDPRTSVADLGRLIESDPALSAQVIRLANAGHYGMAGEVSSASRAVTVLGFATVRALATTAAFDLFSSTGRAVPDDFWAHSVTTAAASAAIARRVGYQPNEAFSAGLLHDVGSALVFRRSPRRYEAVLERVGADPSRPLVDAEREEFGHDHAEVGAAALAAMKFPVALCEAIGAHHGPPESVEIMLGRILIAADAVAIEAGGIDSARNVPMPDALRALELPRSSFDALVEEVRRDQANLSGFLTARG